MKKICALSLLGLFLATASFGGNLSLKFRGGAGLLIGGDFNASRDGTRDYVKSILNPGEKFVDQLKKIGLSYQFSAEVLYKFSLSLAAGLEAGYMTASAESSFERDAYSYHETIKPTLSAVPIMANIHFFKPLGPKLTFQAMAGAGVCLSMINYDYTIESSSFPYQGTFKPDNTVVFGAQAGVGLEMAIAKNLAITLDITGRYAQIPRVKGSWSGIYAGSPRSGNGTLYVYELDGKYTLVGVYESLQSGGHYINVREAKFSLSGVTALVGLKVSL